VAGTPNQPGMSRAVLTGVVSGTCVLVFIKPLLGLLWKVALSNIQSITDSACRNAALGYTDRYGFLGFSAFASMVVGFSSGFLSSASRPALSGGLSQLGFKFYNLIRLRWVSSLLVIGVILLAGKMLAADFIVLQMNASFHQRLAVLSPKITDQDYKELLAAWAAMRSESDYGRIVDQMDDDAKARGIVLPELLAGAAPSR
jgi:hypothetical protein